MIVNSLIFNSLIMNPHVCGMFGRLLSNCVMHLPESVVGRKVMDCTRLVLLVRGESGL